jgi:DNA-binding MurR/RpiR family transcriptional regulator
MAKSQKRVAPEHKLFKKHTGHANHLCELVSKRQMDKVADLSAGAKYICHICGRAAAKPENLCEPVEI